MKNSQTFLSRFLNLVDAAVESNPVSREHFTKAPGNLHVRTLHFTGDFGSVRKVVGWEPSKGFAKKLGELDGRFASGFGALDEMSKLSQSELAHRQYQRVERLVLEGKLDTVLEHPQYQSREQLRESAQALKKAAKLALRNVVLEAVALVKPEAEAFADAINEYADRLAAQESQHAQLLGVAFTASGTLGQLRAAARSVVDMVPTPERALYQRPKSMCPWL